MRELELFLAAAVLLVSQTPTAAGPIADRTDRGDRVAEGRLLYRVYCLNCHGESGRGDGPSAEILPVRPADLTRIRESNGGEFPKERVHRTIDGRHESRGHRQRAMPVWGVGLQDLSSDANQELEVRTRIRSLIDFLETIQRGHPDRPGQRSATTLR